MRQQVSAPKVQSGSIRADGGTVHIDVRGGHQEGPIYQCRVRPLSQVNHSQIRPCAKSPTPDFARVRSRLRRSQNRPSNQMHC